MLPLSPDLDFSHRVCGPCPPLCDPLADEQRLLALVPKIISWNTRGLFACIPAVRRRKLAILQSLLHRAPIVTVQEAHGTLFDFDNVFPDFTKFINCSKESVAGGVAFFVLTSWMDTVLLEYCKVIPGRLSRLRFQPLDVDDVLISIYSIHLEDADHSTEGRLRMLSVLAETIALDHAGLKMVIGDFNFALGPGPENDERLRVARHQPLEQRFLELFPNWTGLDPSMPTYLGSRVAYPSFLDRVFLSVGWDLAQVSGLHVVTLAMQDIFQAERPSDHLPILLTRVSMGAIGRPLSPAIAALPTYTSSLAFEFSFWHFRALSLADQSACLPMIIASAALRAKEDASIIDPSNAELCAYYAACAWHALLRHDRRTLLEILAKTPQWRLSCDQIIANPMILADLLGRLRQEALLARCRELSVEARHAQRTSSRVLKWTRVLAAWRKRLVRSNIFSISYGGVLYDEPTSVVTILAQHWSGVFQPPSIPMDQPLLDELLSCCAKAVWPVDPPVPTSAEIADILRRAAHSAPGPDSLSYQLLLRSGVLVHEHIACLVECWLREGLWPQEHCYNILVAIPKDVECIDSPEKIRPIALSNCVGKVMLMWLARSMYRILDGVLHASQHGFIPGRSIAEALLHLERAALTLGADPESPHSAVVLFDISQAFCSVRHEYLWETLLAMNAPQWLVQSIKAAYTSQYAAFELGNASSYAFKMQRGMRQGCPLSGLLFAISLDPVLRWAELRAPVGTSMRAFADDLAMALKDCSRDGARFILRLEQMLLQTSSLEFKHRKVQGIALHWQYCGYVFYELSRVDPQWTLAVEKDSVTYLGYVFGPGGGVDEAPFSRALSRIRERVHVIDSLELGAPAALWLSRLVLWSCCHHTLSVRPPDAEVLRMFRETARLLLRGPRGWLHDAVIFQMHQLGWPMSVPHPQALFFELSFRLLCRLSCGVDVCGWKRSIESALCNAALPLRPRVLAWAHSSSIFSLASSLNVARQLKLIRVVGRDPIRFELTALPGEPRARQRLFRQTILNHVLTEEGLAANALALWFAKRLTRVLGHPPLASVVQILLDRLCALRSRVRPSRVNAVLRLLTDGVVLDRRLGGQMTCILTSSCGGEHAVNHYLFSECWHTPRLRRALPKAFPLYAVLSSRHSEIRSVVSAVEICFSLVSALNMCCHSEHVLPSHPVEYAFLYRRGRS